MTQLINYRDFEILAEYYMKEGQEDLVNHKNELAIAKMQKALKLLKKAKSTERYVRALNVMGVVYSTVGDEQKAFECYLEALANAEVIKCSYLKALCYINVGSCYQKLERHKEAIKYFKDAEKELSNTDVKKQEKYQMWTMVNYLNLRDAYGEIGEDNKYDECTFGDNKKLIFV